MVFLNINEFTEAMAIVRELIFQWAAPPNQSGWQSASFPWVNGQWILAVGCCSLPIGCAELAVNSALLC